MYQNEYGPIVPYSFLQRRHMTCKENNKWEEKELPIRQDNIGQLPYISSLPGILQICNIDLFQALYAAKEDKKWQNELLTNSQFCDNSVITLLRAGDTWPRGQITISAWVISHPSIHHSPSQWCLYLIQCFHYIQKQQKKHIHTDQFSF